MLVLICSPQPDPLTGTAFPSARPLAGQPRLGLCWLTVLLVFEWGCVSECLFVWVPTRPIWNQLSAGDLLAQESFS